MAFISGSQNTIVFRRRKLAAILNFICYYFVVVIVILNAKALAVNNFYKYITRIIEDFFQFSQ